MAKVLTDEIIPSLKSKIITGGGTDNPYLKTYAVTPTDQGVFNIVDSSLPSSPVEGMYFILRSTGNTTVNPQISINGSAPLGISAQHIGYSSRPDATQLYLGNNYLLVYTNNFWRALNLPAKIDAQDADVASIMNSAGSNAQLFGLGGNVIDISGTNLDNLDRRTRFCAGSNLTNAPYSETWYITQLAYNNNTVIQIAHTVYSANIIYQRERYWSSASNSFVWGAWVRILTAAVARDQVYPVGSHYVSQTLDTPEKVAAALGGGTWIRVSQGLTVFGYASYDEDFNSIKTGGAKTHTHTTGNHTLTVSEIPSHVHNTTILFNDNSGSSTGQGAFYGKHSNDAFATQSTGGGGAHNHGNTGWSSNVPPYLVRYVYTRTA